MARKYFGTDGVRGRVGVAPITPDFALRLAYAAGRVLAGGARTWSTRPAVVIGKDTRVSGYMLEAAMQAGFAAAGVDVMLCGPLPTPGVAYLTRAFRAEAGVVISASHNPYFDNGIKFFSAQGTKLPDSVEEAIEAEIDQTTAQGMPCGGVGEDAGQLGKARRVSDVYGRYIEFCKSTFPNDLTLDGMKLVVDCAHGAAYQTAPRVFVELGAEVINIGNTPNGININEGFGATHPQALAKAVVEHGADAGIALDGDADRIIMVDRAGRVLDGDQLLYAIVRERAARAPVAGVAGTLMTNMALEIALRDQGIAFGRAKVGDRYVMEMLGEKGWLFGGENSGHILCLDCHSTGDGTIAALQVLRALKVSGQDLVDVGNALPLFPQKMINVKVVRGFDWQAHAAIVKAVAEAEKTLAGTGRVLLRPSGTEPVLRVMVEGKDRAQVDGLATQIAAVVEGVARA
jgi:phosphoglucosamine mutase